MNKIIDCTYKLRKV